MKIHVVAATLVACVGSAIRLGLPEKVTLISASCWCSSRRW